MKDKKRHFHCRKVIQELFDWDSAQRHLTEINTRRPYGQELEKLTWVYCNLNKKYLCCQGLYSTAHAAVSAALAPALVSLLVNHLPERLDRKTVPYLLYFQLCLWGWELCVWMTEGKGSGEGLKEKVMGRILYSKGGVVMQLINTSFLYWLYWLFCTTSARTYEREPLWNVTTGDVMVSQQMSVQSAFD